MSETWKLALSGLCVVGAGLFVTYKDMEVIGAFLVIAGMVLLVAVAEEIQTKGENDEQGD